MGQTFSIPMNQSSIVMLIGKATPIKTGLSLCLRLIYSKRVMSLFGPQNVIYKLVEFLTLWYHYKVMLYAIKISMSSSISGIRLISLFSRNDTNKLPLPWYKFGKPRCNVGVRLVLAINTLFGIKITVVRRSKPVPNQRFNIFYGSLHRLIAQLTAIPSANPYQFWALTGPQPKRQSHRASYTIAYPDHFTSWLLYGENIWQSICHHLLVQACIKINRSPLRGLLQEFHRLQSLTSLNMHHQKDR